MDTSVDRCRPYRQRLAEHLADQIDNVRAAYVTGHMTRTAFCSRQQELWDVVDAHGLRTIVGRMVETRLRALQEARHV